MNIDGAVKSVGYVWIVAIVLLVMDKHFVCNVSKRREKPTKPLESNES
jgi:hypothetical protein